MSANAEGFLVAVPLFLRRRKLGEHFIVDGVSPDRLRLSLATLALTALIALCHGTVNDFRPLDILTIVDGEQHECLEFRHALIDGSVRSEDHAE